MSNKKGKTISSPDIQEKPHDEAQAIAAQIFNGFALPSSNTTYTPNQFFDVVLKNARNTGVVRATAYVLRRQLGWCDADGNPQEAQILVNYNDLISHAGIQRKLVRKALDACLESGYLHCVRWGRPKGPGDNGVSSLFELKWDERLEYIKDLQDFSGFFAHEGNRTYIPNQFFDVVVPYENLSVLKVVGAIIRHTIGFQNRYGFRRQQVQMSVTELERVTGLGRRAVREGLKRAVEANYLIRVKDGHFDKNAGLHSTAATYSVRWSDNKPIETTPKPISGKRTTGDQWKKDHGTVEKGPRGISGKRTTGTVEKGPRNGGKRTTGDQWKKDHGLKIKHKNKTERNKTETAAAADFVPKFDLLTSYGFDEEAAQEMGSNQDVSFKQIQNQVNWLPLRKPEKNPLGMLRLAILGNWPKPNAQKLGTSQVFPQDRESKLACDFVKFYYAGYHDNPTTPASDPSEQEIKRGVSFVKGLLEIWKDESKIIEWGRNFGEMVRLKNCHNPEHQPFFNTDRNRYGDEFYRQIVELKKYALREKRDQLWEQHQKKFDKAYLHYLQSEEKRFQSEHSQDYQNFLETWQGERARRTDHETFNKPSKDIPEDFDNDTARLRAFQKFFVRFQADPVLDFFDWDYEKNPQRFDEEAIEL